MSKAFDHTGERFGRLLVLSRADIRKSGEITWNCKCDCGNIVQIRGASLRRGETRSCGCLSREMTSERNSKRMYKHGLYGTRIYRIYKCMKERCCLPSSKSYKYYGGRGIKVCEEWLNSVEAFCEWAQANGYADNLTLDRIDTNGDYSPSNCRWITNEEQQYNKRNNSMITFNGKTQCVTAWAKELGVSRHAIYNRLRRGWKDPKEILLGRERRVAI